MTGPVEGFLAWMRLSQDALAVQRERAQREIASAVVRSVQSLMLEGMSLDNAGDCTIKTFGWGSSGGVSFTPDAVRSVLLAMGWRPKRQRSKGART